MKKNKRAVGFYQEGYWFVLSYHTNYLSVFNQEKDIKVNFVRPASVVNLYDLRIWANGFLAGHGKGWVTLI